MRKAKHDGVILLTKDQAVKVAEDISKLSDEELKVKIKQCKDLPTCLMIMEEEIVRRWLKDH